MANPDVRAVYEKRAAEKDNRPFQMAVSDYFKGIDLLSEKKRGLYPSLFKWEQPKDIDWGE